MRALNTAPNPTSSAETSGSLKAKLSAGNLRVLQQHQQTQSSRPRPSSRQSAVSSSHLNSSQPGLKRKPSSESLITKRPAIITTTVTKSSRIVSSSSSTARRSLVRFASNASTAPTPNNRNSLSPATTPTTPLTPNTPTPTSDSQASRNNHDTWRNALRPRDQNAIPVTVTPARQPSTATKPATMPYERSQNSSNNGGRPQMPTLSASAARGINNKTPLRPKIASPAPHSPHSPLPGRTQQQRPLSTISTPGHAQHDDVLPHLSNNITPRSESRQNRVDLSSREGTPAVDRSEGKGQDNRPPFPSSPSYSDGDAIRRSMASFSPMPLGGPDVQSNRDSKFFYASEVKSPQIPQAPLGPPTPRLAKAPTFFYANGNSVEGDKSNRPVSYPPPASTSNQQQDISSKFIYANGTPDLRPSPPTVPSRPGSVVSTASRQAAPSRAGTSSHNSHGSHGSGHPVSPRPMSPPKYSQQSSVSSTKHNLPQLSSTRAHIASPPPLTPGLRRSSAGTTSQRGHSRSGSLVMAEANMRSSQMSQVSSNGSSPSGGSSPAPRPQPLTLASIIQAAEDFEELAESTPPDGEDEDRSEAQDADKADKADNPANEADPADDLVANARRERKVQDLQITNASLEAINRTLERQLRKQTAELRRFQRLSRAGRLSIAPTAVSTQADSEAHPAEPDSETGLVLSDSNEHHEETEEELEDEEEEESISETDSGSLSPTGLAERDARHSKSDEKRLQVDLTKHQQLLVDSQKINQSIKRCLDWTEELIKEGRKALAYEVRISDVEIPRPRVLNPVDEEDKQSIDSNYDDAMESGLEDNEGLEPKLQPRPMPLEPRLAGWSPSPQDRDSGIELGVDGS